MIKSSWNKPSFSANKNLSFAQNLDSRGARIKQSFSMNKGSKWLEIAKRKLSKIRNGIPSGKILRPWPSGNKIRNH